MRDAGQCVEDGGFYRRLIYALLQPKSRQTGTVNDKTAPWPTLCERVSHVDDIVEEILRIHAEVGTS